MRKIELIRNDLQREAVRPCVQRFATEAHAREKLQILPLLTKEVLKLTAHLFAALF